jgi:pimeloyl-ACP methyl ester carboxylesterase
MTFHVRTYGAIDGAPLVFLHGVMSAAITYDALCRGLARARRVIAIDQRGHGETDHAADYSWERWVEDIALVVEALELGVIDLVGHSMGAAHAARFAALHPGAVRRLGLLEGGFGPTNSPSEPEYWGRVAQLFPQDGFATPEDYVTLAARLFPRADRRILVDSTAGFRQGEDGRWSWPMQADMNVVAGRTNPTPDDEQQLRRAVSCPTLVAKAEYSELFTGDEYMRVAGDYTNGRGHLLRGTGHMLMWEGLANTTAVLEAFLT